MTRAHIHTPRDSGERIADQATAALGSWRFIIAQSIVFALWIVLNSLDFVAHWDSKPFILLNLALSFQAAFTGPIVLLSQNRQAMKDRKRDIAESQEIHEMREGHRLLMHINKQQLEILELLRPSKETQ